MIRLVIFFLVLGVLGLGAAWFADNPGWVLIDWFGAEVETSVAVLLLLASGLGLSVFALFWALQLLLRGPAAWGRYRTEKRRLKRERALVRGFAAVSVGEAETARRYLGEAKGGERGLSQMLGAQIAVLEQDDEAAERYYRQMLQDSDTEFLGLRGLFETAARQGDKAAALHFATRAFHLKPRSAWVAESLFRVQTQMSAWAEAQKTLSTAQRAGGLSAGAARRREAVLQVAEAIAAREAGEGEAALKYAEKALAGDKGLTEAAIIAARIYHDKGQYWSAAGVIERAWARFPHPVLAEAYAGLKPEEAAADRSRRLIGLAEFNASHVEGRILIAGEALKLGELRRARRVLKPVLDTASQRVCLLMGEVEDRAGHDAEALTWRTKAIIAPRDNEWTCADCDHESLDWHPVCGVCGGFDTYVWGTAVPATALPAEVLAPEEAANAEDTGAAGAVQGPPPGPAEAAPPGPPPQSPPGDTAAARRTAGDANIFVPPRPPDDPGTDDRESAAPGLPF